MKYLLILLFCTLLGTPASAQVYRVEDEHGNVTFTDKPPADAEPVEIREPNTTAPPDTTVFPAPPPMPAEEQDVGGSYQVAITAPANETIIPRGPGNFSVSATVSPALGRDHMLQLMMDGAPREEPQTTTTWALTNVFRGEHNITVSVVDKEGKTLATSEPIKVFVFRPSSQFRNSNRPQPR